MDDILGLPKPVQVRVGAKVAWVGYVSMADAEIGAEYARAYAELEARNGNDFGSCCVACDDAPGDIHHDEDNLYWVTALKSSLNKEMR